MKKLLLLVALLGAACCPGALGQVRYYMRMADSEMQRNPEAWMLDFSAAPKWNYCHGLVLQAILQAWEKTGDERYFNYANDYADSMIDDNGAIRGYKPEEYNIDRVNTGKILFPLLARTGDEKYRKAIHALRAQMKTHPRVSDGGFWHKKIYPHQVWLDGLYMAAPFLARHAVEYDEPDLLDDVARQVVAIAGHARDPLTGLFYHGWDESKTQRWANPETGQSPNFWSRAIGWYMMAIVDLLDYLPASHPLRPAIIDILRDLSSAIEPFRDERTGMWYQVTNLPGSEGNYLESTGSIMFIYAWKKGADKGYLDRSYKRKSARAYRSFLEQFVREDAGGRLSITSCCSVSGLGGTPYRDGSYAYYISEPVRDNDPKAVGPFIMTSILFNR
jgi:unsaturated rhamnogalacturonyl hydrolase